MRDSVTRSRPLVLALSAYLILGLAAPQPVAAQSQRLTDLDFVAGGEFEDYLRVMQVAGIAPLYPWSLRGFSPREIALLSANDTAGPWKLGQRRPAAGISAGPFTLGTTMNSAYAYGANDGPVWTGRGVTVAASGGISGRTGRFSFAVAPVFFYAANSAFELLPNGLPGGAEFRHGVYPNTVDLPQRFGAEPYSRLDWGASTVRFDSRPVSLGFSTANQWVGPTTEQPFLLGTNAPGMPRLFLGTGAPLNIWFARIHAQLTWGMLHQSEYSPVSGSSRYLEEPIPGTVRLATSGTVVFLPRGVPGLELGFARFFHVPYREDGPNLRFWVKPFEGVFLRNQFAQGDTIGAQNQLVSLFFRWVFPRNGFEFYGERGYEDHFYDLRDFIQDPDHERSYNLGFLKVFRGRADRVSVLKAELINYQLPTIGRDRSEGLVYLHSPLRQGHTNRGQLLGASAGVAAAAASTLSWTRYSPAGRSTAAWRRIVRAQRGEYHVTGVEDPRSSDIIHALGFERMRFGRRMDIGAKLEVMQNFNRNFSEDVPNLHLQVTARLGP